MGVDRAQDGSRGVAATQVVAATGAGSRRVVRAVDGTLQREVLARAGKLAPRPAERMDELRGNASRLVVQGIDQFEKAAETGMEQLGRLEEGRMRMRDLDVEIAGVVFELDPA